MEQQTANRVTLGEQGERVGQKQNHSVMCHGTYFPSPMVSTPRLPYGWWIPPGEIENFRIHRYWTGASLQGRLMRGGGDIIQKR